MINTHHTKDMHTVHILVSDCLMRQFKTFEILISKLLLNYIIEKLLKQLWLYVN